MRSLNVKELEKLVRKMEKERNQKADIFRRDEYKQSPDASECERGVFIHFSHEDRTYVEIDEKDINDVNHFATEQNTKTSFIFTNESGEWKVEYLKNYLN